MIKKGDKIIVENVKYCNNLFSKAIGLRFKKKSVNTGIIFSFNTPQKVLMDMFFVFYPIDVLFLDENKIIIEIKENFLPFTFYKNSKKAFYIIELNKDTAKKNKIRIGDKLSF